MKPGSKPANPPSRTQLALFTAATAALLLGAGLWSQARLGDRLLPHAFCISASQPLLLLHLVSDGLIAFAYLLIPWAMLNFVRKREDVPFGWVAWVFGAFIVACGITHAMQMWTLYYPVYWYSGVAKAFTAAVSLGTAWLLYRLTPQLLALPSTHQLRDANAALQEEIAIRRQVEQQLQQAKAELEVLLGKSTKQQRETAAVLDRFFEVAPMGLGLLDGDQRFLRANPSLAQIITGRALPEYVGRHVGELPGMPGPVIDAVADVASTGTMRQNVEAAVGPAGQDRSILCSFFPIRWENAKPMVGVILQDITYQRRVERQLLQALEEAQQANHARDEFLARVSHELRSPLQIAVSSAEVLKRMGELPPQARKFVDRVGQAVASQARMINDLLDLSRILSGKMHIALEAVDPMLPLVRVLDHWKAVANDRGVRLLAEGLDAGEVIVQADPTRLEQVYANLIDNAVRFSPPGGSVVLTSERDGGRWRLRVRDAGPGLTRDELRQIFEPFAQAENQPRSGKGLGLGLAIVASLMDAFGGRVWADSAGPGHGSTFSIEIPIDGSAAQSGASTSADRPAPAVRGLRVLYVEDEPEVAHAMGAGLRELGAEVDVCLSYADAAQRLRAGDYDAAVTDLNLGDGAPGQELARLAASLGRSAVWIAVSAFGSRRDLASTAREGFAAHLVKPVSVVEVAEAIARARAGRGGR
ncbi:MAG: hybrid sensor histidine kinase/response regulator [Ramlibacter sp.]